MKLHWCLICKLLKCKYIVVLRWYVACCIMYKIAKVTCDIGLMIVFIKNHFACRILETIVWSTTKVHTIRPSTKDRLYTKAVFRRKTHGYVIKILLAEVKYRRYYQSNCKAQCLVDANIISARMFFWCSR